MPWGQVNADNITDSYGGKVSPISNRFTNRIINGAMMIDQRNAGAAVTNVVGAAYSVDRWVTLGYVASKFTAQQSSTAPVGFSNSLLATSSSAYTVGAGEAFALAQYVEGFNFSDMGWGTANAKTVTLSFQVYSSLTGTFGGALRNNADNRSYPFSYSVPVANTWTTISVTVAGDTTGTWVGSTNGVGVRVIFSLGSGSTFSGTAGAWAGANYFSATGATSVVGTNGATFYITGVQLEKGSTATSFDYRPYGTELSLCQNYFKSATNHPLGLAASGYGYFGQTCFPTTMRVNPTIAGNFVALNSGVVGTFSVSSSSVDGFTPYCSSNNLSVNYQYAMNYTANAEL